MQTIASCRIERTVAGVEALLISDPKCLWALVGAAAAPAASLIALERDYPGRELSRNLTDSERVEASRKASDFFGAAERGDLELRLNLSARVPLAIPHWDDVQQIFRLRAVLELRPGLPIVVWLADPAMKPMLAKNGHSTRLPWPGRAIARAARAALRCLLNSEPALPAGVRLWFTLGRPLGATGSDTYFGDWWRGAPGQNVRIYLAAGRSLRFERSHGEAAVEAFGRAIDILGAMRDCWRVPTPPATLASGDDRTVWRWLARREWASGDMFALAFLRRVFARMLKSETVASAVVPFEGRSWERSLIRLAHRQGIPVVGYQHSSLTPRHLALLESGAGWCRTDLPDRVITCGEVTAERLLAMAGESQTQLVVGAAVRANRQPLPPPGSALLVAISSSRGESRAILQFMHGAANQLQMPIIIRPHPTILIDDLFGEFSWPSSVRLSVGRSLAQDMAEARYIAYSSSTVALEGLIYGRLPVFLDIHDVLSGDPIDDLAFKLKAAGPDELVCCLRDVLNWPDVQLDRARALGFAYAERYLAAPGTERLGRMNDALPP